MGTETAGKGPELSESARRTAAELARLVEEATRDLPFGTEPVSLCAALDRLAAEDDSEAESGR